MSKWKLIDVNTERELGLGDLRLTSRGEEVRIAGLHPPHKPESSGKVSVKYIGDAGADGLYYPSVIGAKFVELPETARAKFQVWYMKPEFFSDGILGKKPDPINLSATHVLLKELEIDGGLDLVYHAMQGEVWSPNGEARDLIKSKGLQHTSMSRGDVVVDENNHAHVVAAFGFDDLGEVVQAEWKRRAIAATRGTQFGAILCAATETKIDPPCFTSRATVTSDGYVMADFTGADGRQHMGAFVGSVADLVRNTLGLAHHLKLNQVERAALFAVIRNWIDIDYVNDAVKTALKSLEIR